MTRLISVTALGAGTQYKEKDYIIEFANLINKAIKSYAEIPEFRAVVILKRSLDKVMTNRGRTDQASVRRCLEAIYVAYEAVRRYDLLPKELKLKILSTSVDLMDQYRKAIRISWGRLVSLGKNAYESIEFELNSFDLTRLISEAKKTVKDMDKEIEPEIRENKAPIF
jgi:hypothetical protein